MWCSSCGFSYPILPAVISSTFSLCRPQGSLGQLLAAGDWGGCWVRWWMKWEEPHLFHLLVSSSLVTSQRQGQCLETQLISQLISQLIQFLDSHQHQPNEPKFKAVSGVTHNLDDHMQSIHLTNRFNDWAAPCFSLLSLREWQDQPDAPECPVPNESSFWLSLCLNLPPFTLAASYKYSSAVRLPSPDFENALISLKMALLNTKIPFKKVFFPLSSCGHFSQNFTVMEKLHLGEFFLFKAILLGLDLVTLWVVRGELWHDLLCCSTSFKGEAKAALWFLSWKILNVDEWLHIVLGKHVVPDCKCVNSYVL